MATNNGMGLYGFSSGTGTYGDANVEYLLGASGNPYQYPILSNNSITAAGNISGNIIVGTAFTYPNNVSIFSNLYSNANASYYLPIYSGNTAATLTTADQPYITVVGPQVNLTAASNVNLNNFQINNLALPSVESDAASKNYVDAFVQGLQLKEAVQVGTTAALPAYNYYNGPLNDGAGATLTGISQGNLVIDGITVTPGQRILVKDETTYNLPFNGIYTVSVNGPSNYYVLTRATDMNQALGFYSAFTYIQQGSQAGETWADLVNNNSVMVVGTTPVPWTNFQPAISYNAGPGIHINTGQISADVDNSTLAINGSGQIYSTGNLGSANITTLTVTTESVTGTSTINHLVGNTISANIGNIVALNSGNILNTGTISSAGNITVGPGSYYVGNGSQLTGMYSNANVIAFMPTYAGNLVSVGNIISTGIIQAQSLIGNISVVTPQTLGVGNLIVNGNADAGYGYASITGNVTAANISSQGNVIGNSLYINNNGVILGNLQVQGNITFIDSTTVTTNDLVFALANNQTSLANINGAGLTAGPESSPLTNWTYNSGPNAWSTNVNISATGIVTAQSFVGNVSFPAGSIISTTGNVVASNISTTGNVSAGGNLNTSGSVNVSGSVNAASFATSNFTISQSGSKLYFYSNGTAIMSLDSVGNIITLNNVTGYGAP